VTHTRRVFRPVLVEVESGEQRGLYEIHLGRPGKPRVYQRIGNQGLRRVLNPAALEAVAMTFGKRLATLKERQIAEKARRAKWHYRARLWVGRTVARLWAWLRRRWTGR
jgi:hypothetical protein